MKSYVLLSIVGGIVLGAPAVQGQELSGAPLLDMPLLSNWIRSLEAGQTPAILGKPRPLTKSALEGFDFSVLAKEPVTGLEAKFYRDKTLALMQVTVDRKDFSEKKALAWDVRGVRPLEWDWRKDGWFNLVENRQDPLAIWLSPKATNANAQGQAVSLVAKDQSLTVHPPPSGHPMPPFHEQYAVGEDSRTRALGIINRITDKNIATIPKPGGKGNYQSLDSRSVGNRIMAAGFETNETGQLELVWHLLQPADKSWRSVRKRMDQAYLDSLLPPALAGMTIDFERSGHAKLWRDGRLVFLLHCEQRKGSDRLTALLLVVQSQDGPPRLANWQIVHRFEPLPRASLAGREAKIMGDASRAFNHAWFVGPEGKVASRFVRTDINSDFLFDMDAANNSIIYLLGGQL